jgi:hypothetical protein
MIIMKRWGSSDINTTQLQQSMPTQYEQARMGTTIHIHSRYTRRIDVSPCFPAISLHAKKILSFLEYHCWAELKHWSSETRSCIYSNWQCLQMQDPIIIIIIVQADAATTNIKTQLIRASDISNL